MILLNTSDWEVRTTKNKGKGVFALKPIKKNILVANYHGEVVLCEDVDWEKYEDYVMYLDDSKCIIPDLTTIGAHLINHSCNPNCEIKVQSSEVNFVSIRPIKAGEEITINYKYPPKVGECLKNCKHKCYCDDANCNRDMHRNI